MQIFSFKKKDHLGYATRKNIWVYLRNVDSMNELYEVLEHEELHRILYKIGISNVKNVHHKIMRAVFLEI